MNITKKIYHSIIPSHLRLKRRLLTIKYLRRLRILDFIRKLGFLTCKDYLAVNVSNAEEIFKARNKNINIFPLVEENLIKPALHLQGQEVEGMQPFVARTEAVVLEINTEKFSFRNNHLIDSEMNVIGESEIEFERLPIYIQQVLEKKVTRLNGTVAYLSDPDPANYYHWMCRTLPRLRLYQQFFGLKTIDFFYVGQFPLSGFHKESLEKVGITMNRVIQEACTADKIVASITNRACSFGDPINKESYLFARNLFYKNPEKGKSEKKRIYVRRGNVNRRKVVNEFQVIELLEKKYGFETIEMDNKTLKEQAKIFFNAEAIVTLHGAALTNLLFIQARTKVIELIPYGYVNNCFYAMASYGDADYFYLQGEKTAQRDSDVRNLDLYVDLQKLDKICQMASLEKVRTV